jgi:cation diffusion facilitator CzcD-associated flavoprotein CzcO
MTSRRANSCEVAVIGAGPYGLSVAAHLDHAGLATRVFGEPMGFWRRHMPKGMMLRSPWHGTHISSPDSSHSLDVYAIEHDVDDGKLLPLESFVDYGEWFQKHAVPQLDRRTVAQIDAASDGFRLMLADGEIVTADRVVVATGLRNQDYRPDVFAGLPAALVSHSSQHADLGIFRGKHVAVIGRGQSACESAALLAESGAQTDIISRGDIHWLAHLTDGNAGKPRLWRLREALAAPSAVGPFPLSWLAEFPGLVRRLPAKLRDEFTQRCLKAGAAGWLKPRFANVAINAGRRIERARAISGRIVLVRSHSFRNGLSRRHRAAWNPRAATSRQDCAPGRLAHPWLRFCFERAKSAFRRLLRGPKLWAAAPLHRRRAVHGTRRRERRACRHGGPRRR